ncbi:SufS family cysteine desulfurase [Candidatus Uhrbacteria bacterium]|nr:SufS family cysteine desulfurase [Candidatus Uhrbacteria bacterium]
MDVPAIRAEFPIFKRKVNGHRLVFLDSAASAQKPQAVIDAMTRIYTHSYANVHRGLYTLAEEATEAYEGARAKVARFINAADVREVINVRNATEGINLVAYAWGREHIQAGDRIVITELEHHANLVPWQQLAKRQGAELAYIPVTEEGLLDLDAVPPLLDDGRTKLVACSVMSNVLGTLPPVTEVAEMAHASGAIVVMDGAQAVPHQSIDVQTLGADFMAFSGHKMCGPGVGVLWGRRELLTSMPPFLYGGDMILTVKQQDAKWNELPYKFEAGTPPIAEVVGLGAAVDFLTDIGMDAIHAHEQDIVAYAMERLAEIPDLDILGPGPAERGGVISFWMGAAHPHDIAAILDSEGVCVRAGHHCAQPLHDRFCIPASARASFYIYNDKDDVDVLVEALDKVVRILGRR